MTSEGARIFILDDEQDMAENLGRILTRAGHQPIICSDSLQAMALIEQEKPDLVVTDLRMPGLSGMELLERLAQAQIRIPVVIITGYATVDAAVDAMKKGASDFLAKPFPPEELTLKVARALDLSRIVEENKYLRKVVLGREFTTTLVGQSEPMRRISDILAKISDTDSRVLITGESGTGKEVVAKTIHEGSSRRDSSFFAINCAALTESLLESELFGHEKGAFTGAISLKKGVFEMADGGTLFLDEIGDTSHSFQAKLLRVIEESEFKRVGGTRSIRTSVRIVSSTNKDLRREIDARRFREDLFYRLCVVSVHMPPLRERREDIPLLAEHFLRKHFLKTAKRVTAVGPAAMRILMEYHWPGNVRELENVMERAMIMASGAEILPQDVPLLTSSLPRKRGGTLEELERELIERTLAECDWNKTLAARRLGIGRRTLYEKASRFGIRLGPDESEPPR